MQQRAQESHGSEPGACTEAVLAALLSFCVDSGVVSGISSTGTGLLIYGERTSLHQRLFQMSAEQFPVCVRYSHSLDASADIKRLLGRLPVDSRLPRMPKILITASTLNVFFQKKERKTHFYNYARFFAPCCFWLQQQMVQRHLKFYDVLENKSQAVFASCEI